MDWYLNIDAKEPLGPLSTEKVRKWIKEKKVTYHMKICAVGDSEWESIGKNEHFADAFSDTPPPPPPPNEGVTSTTTQATSAEKSIDVLGVLLLLLPFVGMIILFFAGQEISGEFILLQARQIINSTMSLVYGASATVIILSAVLVGIDASQKGFGQKSAKSSALRTGSASWVIGQILLWVISYPWYMIARSKTGKASGTIGGIAVIAAIFFVVGSIVVVEMVESRKADIRYHIAQMEQESILAQENLRAELRDIQSNSQKLIQCSERCGAECSETVSLDNAEDPNVYAKQLMACTESCMKSCQQEN